MSTWPVSLSRAAIPTSLPIPRPSRTATTYLLTSLREDTAVTGLPVVGREWRVAGRERDVVEKVSDDDSGRVDECADMVGIVEHQIGRVACLYASVLRGRFTRLNTYVQTRSKR